MALRTRWQHIHSLEGTVREAEHINATTSSMCNSVAAVRLQGEKIHHKMSPGKGSVRCRELSFSHLHGESLLSFLTPFFHLPLCY